MGDITMDITSELVTGGVAIIVCLINNYFVMRKSARQHLKTEALIEYKLDQLTDKVELHNNAVERLFIAEGDIKVLDERLTSTQNRIDDLHHR